MVFDHCCRDSQPWRKPSQPEKGEEMNSFLKFFTAVLMILMLLIIGCSNPNEPEIQTVANPEILPVSGSYSLPQQVTIVCSTPEVQIYYSLNGDDPDLESTLYNGSFTLLSSATVKARAYKAGWNPSSVVNSDIAIDPERVSTPSFSLPEGDYNGIQTVSIQCATEGATIRYTTDGSTPNENSSLYEAPITLSATTILGAKAFKENYLPSQPVYALYNIDLTPPLEMMLIPSGSVTMGDTRGEGYNDDQYPTHTIHISSFYLAKYELLQSQYQAIMGSLPETTYGESDYHPVYNLSWYAAIKFCNLLSMRDGYTPVYSISGTTNPSIWGDIPTQSNPSWNAVMCDWNADGYRLPTEAEWEYAARGATMSPDYVYSGSNQSGDVAWCATNPANVSHEVGQKAPNGLGLYDMSGNVYEWCWDWYYGYSAATQYNPHGPNNGSYRILRGGAWDSPFFRCSVFYRSTGSPHLAPLSAGLRICRKVND